MPNRKVLLTGASGYIASQILPAFQDQFDMALIDVNDSDWEGRKVSGVALDWADPGQEDQPTDGAGPPGNPAPQQLGGTGRNKAEDQFWASGG